MSRRQDKGRLLVDSFRNIDTNELDEMAMQYQGRARKLVGKDKSVQNWPAFIAQKQDLETFRNLIPLIQNLRQDFGSHCRHVAGGTWRKHCHGGRQMEARSDGPIAVRCTRNALFLLVASGGRCSVSVCAHLRVTAASSMFGICFRMLRSSCCMAKSAAASVFWPYIGPWSHVGSTPLHCNHALARRSRRRSFAVQGSRQRRQLDVFHCGARG